MARAFGDQRDVGEGPPPVGPRSSRRRTWRGPGRGTRRSRCSECRWRTAACARRAGCRRGSETAGSRRAPDRREAAGCAARARRPGADRGRWRADRWGPRRARREPDRGSPPACSRAPCRRRRSARRARGRPGAAARRSRARAGGRARRRTSWSRRPRSSGCRVETACRPCRARSPSRRSGSRRRRRRSSSSASRAAATRRARGGGCSCRTAPARAPACRPPRRCR